MHLNFDLCTYADVYKRPWPLVRLRDRYRGRNVNAAGRVRVLSLQAIEL